MLRNIALALFLLLPCASARAECPAVGDTIVIGTIGDATSMIPMLTSDSASHEMSGYIYSGLLKYDKDLNLVGDLAESWEISDDGLTITFYLHKDVRFHDGMPYTAHDALFNWQFMVDPQTPTGYAADYLQVKEARVLDDYTFQVTYAQPYSHALSSWTLPQMPRHLLEGIDPRQSSLNRYPIGTGPYKFVNWRPGERLTLAYNEDYFAGRPCIDAIMYRVIPDLATTFMELSAGNLDWSSLTATQYRRQTDTPYFDDNFNKYSYLASSYSFLGWNMKDPRFQDKRIRQALSYAIDRQEIIDGVLLGLGREATGPLKPGTYWYNPNVRRYPYDPQKALELFAQAGWKQDEQGILRNAKGQAFEFVLITNQGHTYRQNAGIFIQYRLAQIGIKVELRVIEWTAFLKEFVNSGRFDAVLLGWTMPPDPGLHQIFHSSQTNPGELNFTGFQNPELDMLLDEELLTMDMEKRREIYFRIQEILAEEQPYAFLFIADALPILHKRFHGIEPTVAGISHNFLEWYVPEQQRKRGNLAAMVP